MDAVFFYYPIKISNEKIMVASLGKAIGITGGVIASDQLFINQILSNSSFISSAGMSPPLLPMGKQQLYKNQHIKLKTILNTLTPYW
jgi:7-keto-8-aminopelargonate synthetase-like enzyme